jgi:hypothetical protein
MFQLVKRTAAFVLLTACLYLGGLWASARLRYGNHTLLQYLTHNLLEPGGNYQTLRRFREVEGVREVDIAFVGSSHGYRGFDPRIFAAAGYRSYNLSSTNQSPLNTYHVAKRYLPALAPRLVVFEIYYPTLHSDGYESFRDLTVNTPWSWPLFEMALATRQSSALNYSVAKALGLTPDESKAMQAPVAGERYVVGGYCETTRQRAQLERAPAFNAIVASDQMDYLAETTRYAASLGARVVWVTHPLPADHLERVRNLSDVRATLAGAAEALAVPYWDYSQTLELDPLTNFADAHHLNATGVALFNQAFLVDLRASGLLP